MTFVDVFYHPQRGFNYIPPESSTLQ